MKTRERLQRRVDRILAMLDLEDVEQLAEFNERDLRCLPRVGNLTFREIVRQLKRIGLTLKHYGGGTEIHPAVRRVLNREDVIRYRDRLAQRRLSQS